MYTTKPAAERAYTAYRAQLQSATIELVAIAKAGKEKVGPGPGWHGPPKGTHVPRKETALWASQKTSEVKLASGKKVRVDVGIAPLTQTLNNSGLETTHSCSGHSGSSKSVETQISFRHTTRSEPAVEKLRGVIRSGELSQSWMLTDRPMNFHSLHLRRGFYGDRSLPSTNEQIIKVRQDLGRFQKELESPEVKADLAELQNAVIELAAEGKKKGPGPGWWGPPRGTHKPLTPAPPKANAMRAKLRSRQKMAAVAKRHGVSVGAVEKKCTATAKAIIGETLSIRRGAGGARDISESGRFKTQFETGKSGGYFDTEVRTDAEFQGLGIPRDIAATARPVYAYFDTPKHSAAQFGPMEFQLKDAVKDRTTVTFGDSLPFFRRREVIGTPARSPTSESWNMPNAAEKLFAGEPQRFRYVEGQVHGGLSTKDIARVVVHKGALGATGAPTRRYGATIRRLQKAGVEVIYDPDTD